MPIPVRQVIPLVDHTHATDPYLRVTYKLSTDSNNAASDSVFVSWSTSYAKNFTSGRWQMGRTPQATR